MTTEKYQSIKRAIIAMIDEAEASVDTIAATIPALREIKFCLPVSASADIAWSDTHRAMREIDYQPKPGKRYRIDFANHSITPISRLPSCMNVAIDGIADALGAERARLLIGYRQVRDGRGTNTVDVLITELATTEGK